MRHLLLRVFKILLVLSIGGFLWSSYYLYTKGFSRSWRNRLVYEFQRHGVELSVRRLTLDPFRGLIAKDVRIFEGPGSSDVVALVSHIGLDINYGNLARGEAFLNAIDLRDTNLSLQIDRKDKDAPKLEVAKLKARVLFPPQQIRVTQAQFEVAGITFMTSGNLLVPEGYKLELPEQKEGDNPILRQFLEELDNTVFDPAHARVSLEFSGDVSKLDEILLEDVVFDFGVIKRPRFALAGLSAEMNYRDKALSVTSLRVQDARGVLSVAGFFNTDVGEGRLQLQSTLELQPIIAELVGRDVLGEITFYSEPEVDAYVTIDTKAERKVNLVGGVSVEKFAIRSLVFDSFHADFSWDGDQTLVRNIELLQRSGGLTGQVLHSSDDVRVMVKSTIDPTAIAPLFGGNVHRFLSQWEFEDAPKIEFEGRGPGPDLDVFEANGRIDFGGTTYRGTSILDGHTDIQITDGKTIYKDFLVRRPEGNASGTLIFDFRNQYVYMDDVRTQMMPVDVAIWIGPRLLRDVTPYRFNKPPELLINGRVKVVRRAPPISTLLPVRRAQPVDPLTPQHRPPVDANLQIRANAADGMRYTFLGKELPFRSLSGDLIFEGRKLKLRNVSGVLFGGTTVGSADISLDRANQRYKADVSASNIDFESLTNLYFGYSDSAGKLSGTYKFTGKGMDRLLMVGSGNVEVVEGDVFAIPFLGPISMILDTIVPGMGVSKARKGTATFTIREGVIHTDDLLVAGQGFGLIGNGDLFFARDEIDFDVRINARGLPGVLLFPVSKLFEYTSQGSLRNPVWSPKLLTP